MLYLEALGACGLLGADSVDLKDKKVALLGTGSSAVQILPQVQKGQFQINTVRGA